MQIKKQYIFYTTDKFEIDESQVFKYTLFFRCKECGNYK